MSLENPFEENTPSTNPEQQPEDTERSPEKRIEHLRALAELVTQTGFEENPELKEMRMINPSLWAERAMVVVDQEGVDQETRDRLALGYLVALAAVYYELNNKDEYFTALDDATIIAWNTEADDIYRKLIEMGGTLPE